MFVAYVIFEKSSTLIQLSDQSSYNALFYKDVLTIFFCENQAVLSLSQIKIDENLLNTNVISQTH